MALPKQILKMQIGIIDNRLPMLFGCKRLTYFLLIALLQLSCLSDADRNNLLDPKSDRFKNAGSVSGQVSTFYAPVSPMADVEVRLLPETFVTTTDANGAFQFKSVPVGKYTVSASKTGFASDTLAVDVRLEGTDPIDIKLLLDALPVINSFLVNSCRIDRVFPLDDLFFLEVTARVDDPDGFNDIDFVEFEIPDIGFIDTLDVTETPTVYSKAIIASQIELPSLYDLLGMGLMLKAHDRPGFTTLSQPKFLARVIGESPQIDSPQGFELVSNNPTLVWKKLVFPFEFKFKVEIVSVDLGINIPVLTKPDIEKAATSIVVADSLGPGNYNWTITAIDNFGNCSRSKVAAFRIN